MSLTGPKPLNDQRSAVLEFRKKLREIRDGAHSGQGYVVTALDMAALIEEYEDRLDHRVMRLEIQSFVSEVMCN